MSGNNYTYFYPPNGADFNPNHTWNKPPPPLPQFNGRSNLPSHHTMPPLGYPPPPPPPSSHRNQNFFNANQRQFSQPPPPIPRRFATPNQQQPQPSWQQRNNYHHNNNKRPRLHDNSSDLEPKSKSSKKKKKPLSQNVPSKKEWTLEEAEEALNVEKEYNKRFKHHSLIIKFPDLELNRDIVSKFHPCIENVHFQQPSTPRFCFVTLQETADAETVINHLNTIKFGEGFLTAEYKKDREEDQNIGPEDIDPCTLYVGNLAQEITKEDMVKTYPKGRRIDIGYAKKMKYTRYAFVSFKNVPDSIEAFKKTHSTQMYSKSLIVRFRRLHGTVGMPGESKPQSPVKPPTGKEQATATSNDDAKQTNKSTAEQEKQLVDASPPLTNVDLSVVKQEINSSDDEEYESPFLAGSIDVALEQHRPIAIKREIKEEIVDECSASTSSNALDDVIQTNALVANVKSEPQEASHRVKSETNEEEEDDETEEEELNQVNFSQLLNQFVDHSNQIESLRKSIP